MFFNLFGLILYLSININVFIMQSENLILLKRIIREEFDNCQKEDEFAIIEMVQDLEHQLNIDNEFSQELTVDSTLNFYHHL